MIKQFYLLLSKWIFVDLATQCGWKLNVDYKKWHNDVVKCLHFWCTKKYGLRARIKSDWPFTQSWGQNIIRPLLIQDLKKRSEKWKWGLQTKGYLQQLKRLKQENINYWGRNYHLDVWKREGHIGDRCWPEIARMYAEFGIKKDVGECDDRE